MNCTCKDPSLSYIKSCQAVSVWSIQDKSTSNSYIIQSLIKYEKQKLCPWTINAIQRARLVTETINRFSLKIKGWLVPGK